MFRYHLLYLSHSTSKLTKYISFIVKQIMLTNPYFTRFETPILINPQPYWSALQRSLSFM